MGMKCEYKIPPIRLVHFLKSYSDRSAFVSQLVEELQYTIKHESLLSCGKLRFILSQCLIHATNKLPISRPVNWIVNVSVTVGKKKKTDDSNHLKTQTITHLEKVAVFTHYASVCDLNVRHAKQEATTQRLLNLRRGNTPLKIAGTLPRNHASGYVAYVLMLSIQLLKNCGTEKSRSYNKVRYRLWYSQNTLPKKISSFC